MALVAEDLGYTYSSGTRFETHALRRISLSVAPGELVIVVGATGSGKSTLLRLLAGLLQPSAGRVEVDGRLPGDPAVRGTIGLVFQDPESQFFAESVLEDVAFGPRNLGLDDPTGRATRAIGAVGLDTDEFGGRSPFTLSGGEARRAAIAGILAFDPAYVLLDEPTAGLDRRGRVSVARALAGARRTSGVLVVTHDPEQFLGDADRVLVLKDGSQAWSGSRAGLMSDPSGYRATGMPLPLVMEAQIAARDLGAAIDVLTLDPRGAANAILEARRRLA